METPKQLLKLSDDHYVICDDSEIKEGDWCVYNTGEIIQYLVKLNTDNLKKITHSTKSLDTIILKNRNGSQAIGNHYGHIGKLTLSEVEEAINGYSVEKIAKE